MTRLALAALFVFELVVSASASQSLNVVLVVVDTLRADHTSVYGYARDTTPNLAALAKKGLVFETALAQTDWTHPAFATLFTGLRPGSHGVIAARDRLSPDLTTLAQVFAAHGFATAGFSAGLFDEAGLGKGFQTNKAEWGLQREALLADTLPPAVDWMKAHAKAPFFLAIHGMDAHLPYACPKEDQERFLPTGLTLPPRFTASYNHTLTEATKPLVVAQYDGCIRYADTQLAVLMKALDALALWKNTIVVFTADHGEELGEHGQFGHFKRPLYEEIVRVPLVVVHPALASLAGRRSPAPFEEIDLLPTLLDWEGWPIPPGVQGKILQAVLDGKRPSRVDGYYAQASSRAQDPSPPLDFEAYRQGDWKLLRIGDAWRLYDLTGDPGETKDVAAENTAVVAQLRARLDAARAGTPAAPQRPPATLTPQERERLIRDGYLTR